MGKQHGTAGPPHGRSSLPTSRAFVVQFTEDTAPGGPCFRGRVEHIESGGSRQFASLDDLAAFFAQALAADDLE